MKKATKMIIGGLVVFGIIGACCDTDVEDTKEEEKVVQEEKQEEKQEQEVKEEVKEEVIVEEEKLPTVGEVAEAKKYSLVVNDFYETDMINSNNMFIDNVTTEGKFVVANVTITNKENKPNTYSDMDLTLKSGDSTYSATNNFDIQVILTDEYLSYQQVNPGMSITATVVFEIPADLEHYQLHMGYFDTVDIELK